MKPSTVASTMRATSAQYTLAYMSLMRYLPVKKNVTRPARLIVKGTSRAIQAVV